MNSLSSFLPQDKVILENYEILFTKMLWFTKREQNS